MQISKHILLYCFICLFSGFGTFVLAQVDPAKMLVGRWEGTVDAARNPDRVLIIDSVSPKDGAWVGAGRFIASAGKEQKVTINILSQDGKLVLNFEAGGAMHNPWHFTLVGDDQLEGTGNFVSGHGSRDRAAKLQKVEQK